MTDALTLPLQPGLDEGLLGALRAARAVALARHHESPVQLDVDDAGKTVTLTLAFAPPSPRSRSAWADRDRTTEWAAEAIALEVVHATRSMGTIRRAARGTRFDWYVGCPGTDLEDAVALEIGGTDAQPLRAVLKRKLRQLRRRPGGQPGLAVVVQMSAPRAMMEDA